MVAKCVRNIAFRTICITRMGKGATAQRRCPSTNFQPQPAATPGQQSTKRSHQVKMFKINIAIIFTIAMILHGCNGQNLTALVTKCDQDVEIWKAEAEKWHKNYIVYIICSSLAWFGGLVSVLCWYKRKWNIDARKRLGF